MSLRNFTLPALAGVLVLVIGYSEKVAQPVVPPGPVEVTYWEKWTGGEAESLRDVVDEFNRSQNRIHVNLMSISGIANKTLLAVAGGNPPDVAGLWGNNVAQYADARALTPLDAYCAKAGITEAKYIPAYWKIGFYQGHVYALPSTPASTALHYNRAMLKKGGFDPDKPPQTLEEMDTLGDKLTTRDAQGRLATSGFMPSEPGWWNWGWGYVFGGQLWNGKDRMTANCPENIRAMEWVQSYSRKYGATDLQTFRSGFGNFSSPQNAWLSEKVAMELQGVWMQNYLRQYAPKLDWTAAPFPHPADRPDLANSTFVDEDILVIPRGAKHPEEAFEFIRYIQSQKGMEALCIGHGKNSPLADISEDFWRKHPNKHIRLFTELSKGKNARVYPQIGIWPEYLAELNNAFDEIVLLKQTPKEALDQVQARMQPKLDEYLERLRMREDAEARRNRTP